MSGDAARSALDARVLEWIAEVRASGEQRGKWQRDEERFDALARDLFEFQHEHCAPYRHFCEARGVRPERVERWQEIPCVPTGAFKEVALRSFPAETTCKTFRTSGTSSARRGELHLDTLALYEASLITSLERMLGLQERLTVRVLAPSPAEAPDSSLSHMFGRLLDEYGDRHSGFDVRAGELDASGLGRALEGAGERAAPLLLCGTAFAFVHWMESAEGQRTHPLPPQSRIMETGGFKGRARERSQPELYAELADAFAVKDGQIVNQYGMTELGSQFYDSVWVDPQGPRRKLVPPWVGLRIVEAADEDDGGEVEAGQSGGLQIFDLANTGSLFALRTADLGRRIVADGEDGFEVLGREAGAEERGCSIAADAMLGSSSTAKTP